MAFVTLETGRSGDDALIAELRAHVGKEIGPIAKPDEIRFTDSLPKTRSGKIMRRILRALASGQEVSGDTSTLEDRSVLDALRVWAVPAINCRCDAIQGPLSGWIVSPLA